ncbi:hypothetical protein TIFTF001_029746 [Ficus carica]|uniref:Uncharacterized protein n=1 Tax=Ficus carica TaxID=3494 RepID=A0AA88DT02_FICCA|nr:hypothetical protein TIFTF001_029746 [Ficus carica]
MGILSSSSTSGSSLLAVNPFPDLFATYEHESAEYGEPLIMALTVFFMGGRGGVWLSRQLSLLSLRLSPLLLSSPLAFVFSISFSPTMIHPFQPSHLVKFFYHNHALGFSYYSRLLVANVVEDARSGVPTGGYGSPVEGGTVDAKVKLVSVLVNKLVAVTMTTLVM